MNANDCEKSVPFTLLELKTRYNEIEKTTQYFGTDVSIHKAEIHMVSTIADNPGIHVRGLAELLGITSASVSEIVRKLERKELIYKETDSNNISRLLLYLTKKGEHAHGEHLRYHKMLEKAVIEELSLATEQQKTFLVTFLTGLLKRFEEVEEQLK